MACQSPPPPEYRFKPGKSGNPRGRPKGSKNKRTKMRTPALHETIRFPVGGVMRRMPRREAIVRFAEMRMFKTQDDKLATLLLEANQKLREAEAAVDYGNVFTLIAVGVSFWRVKNIEAAVDRLGLGKLIFPGHSAQRVALTPEVVTLALCHMKGRQLYRDEQKLVLSFTLTPHKVHWPDWWAPDLRRRKCRVPERFFKDDDAEWRLTMTEPPPPPAPPPPPVDLEAEMEKEWRKWVCKYTSQHPHERCADCIRAKPKKDINCPNAAPSGRSSEAASDSPRITG